jgi:hypothetical protein
MRERDRERERERETERERENECTLSHIQAYMAAKLRIQG